MRKCLITIALVLSLIFSMAIVAFAAEAVPSIEQKGVPEVVDTSDPSIELVPLYSADSESELREAYEDIKEVDLGDDVVVRDLFNVVGNVESGSITVDVSKYGDNFFVLEYVDGEWKQIPASRVVFNDDGTVTIYLDELCPLAFATGTPSGDGHGHGCPFILCRIFDTDIACNHTHCLEFNGRCFCWIWWLLLFIIILIIILSILRYIQKKVKKQEEKQEEKKQKKEEAARARREERKRNK